MSISAADVKALRDRTGAAMMDCKAALEESGGDLERAIEVLRVRGQAQAAKRGAWPASEGVVASYVHANAKLGVLVEVNCETDFVARNERFQEFARDVALHVAATNPRWVSEEDVPQDARETELRIFREQAAADGKPEEVQERMAEGRMRKWLDEMVLLRQPHVNADKHAGRTIEELRAEIAAGTGENVVVRRFARMLVGEG